MSTKTWHSIEALSPFVIPYVCFVRLDGEESHFLSLQFVCFH